MKKIRLMLSIVAIVAIVGGTLAFNVSHKTTDKYCTTVNNDVTGRCPNFLDISTTTPNTGQIQYKWTFTNGIPERPCHDQNGVAKPCILVTSFTDQL